VAPFVCALAGCSIASISQSALIAWKREMMAVVARGRRFLNKDMGRFLEIELLTLRNYVHFHTGLMDKAGAANIKTQADVSGPQIFADGVGTTWSNRSEKRGKPRRNHQRRIGL
jgi:hypothetical protein